MVRLRLPRRFLVISCLVAAGSLTPVSPAAATTHHVTHSEAVAVFHSTLKGRHAADISYRATIRPLPDEGFDGRHFCAGDWHVIALTDSGGGDKSYSRQDFLDFIAHDVIVMRLDGAGLPTTRTRVMRMHNPPPPYEKAFFFQQGRVMSPSELTVGAHTLDVTATFPPDTFELHITFYIDAPGTGVCAHPRASA